VNPLAVWCISDSDMAVVDQDGCSSAPRHCWPEPACRPHARSGHMTVPFWLLVIGSPGVRLPGMFGRRAAELAGVLVASLISTFVTAQALSRPHDPLLYVLGAAVPLALLVVYWFWIEPRAGEERVRARRLHRAVEDAIQLSYRSESAAGSGGVPNLVRRSFYEKVDIADMFEPDHLEAAATLRARLDAGRALHIGSSTATRICPTQSTDGRSSPHRTFARTAAARGTPTPSATLRFAPNPTLRINASGSATS
jgi:hypothetical protein